MPLTPSQKSAAFRARRAAKIERYEAALWEIAETWHEQLNPKGWRVGSKRYDPADIARQALNANNEVKS